MKQTTLCFLVKDDRVLLAMKKRGFGVGRWNGVGGKLQKGETIEAAAVREIKEEIGVDVREDNLENIGKLSFSFQDNQDWNQECAVFIVRDWHGEPTESEEMHPQWYQKDKVPFHEMWVDDPHWLPLVLAGKKIEGEFLFNATGDAMVNFSVAEVAP